MTVENKKVAATKETRTSFKIAVIGGDGTGPEVTLRFAGPQGSVDLVWALK